MTKANIVHVSTVHKATDERIFVREASSLSNEGYKVIVVAVHPKRIDVRNNIQIQGLKEYDRRIIRMTIGVLKAFLVAIRFQNAVYHLHDPELLPMAAILRLLNKKVVFDLHERISHDILDKHWIPEKWRKIFYFLGRIIEQTINLVSTRIVTATLAIQQSCPVEKTICVQNFPVINLNDFDPGSKKESTQLRIIYAGELTEIRGIREILNAYEKVCDIGVELTLAGKIDPPEFEKEISAMPVWNKVRYLGFVDRNKVREEYTNADIGIILFHPLANHVASQPNKLFEYMAAGLAIIASDFALWKELIERNNCGKCADPFNADAVAAVIRTMRSEPNSLIRMGTNGINAVKTKYNWELEKQNLLKLYAEITQ